MIRLRLSRPEDGARAVDIWRAAIDATHHFLSPEDRLAIDEEVCAFLPQMPLWLAIDEHDRAIAFMRISGPSMEALFVHPHHHGKGIGRALVHHALDLEPVLTTTVNVQNEQAVGFYERLGFTPTGRTDIDEQGRPYPLLYLRIETNSELFKHPNIEFSK